MIPVSLHSLLNCLLLSSVPFDLLSPNLEKAWKVDNISDLCVIKLMSIFKRVVGDVKGTPVKALTING